MREDPKLFRAEIDAHLRDASRVLMAEMQELIRLAKMLQIELKDIAEQRRKLFLDE